MKARAIENTVFVAASSQLGRKFTGRSMVVDPLGIVVCDAGDEERLAVCEIDVTKFDRVRRVLPSLEHVRSDLYNLL